MTIIHSLDTRQKRKLFCPLIIFTNIIYIYVIIIPFIGWILNRCSFFQGGSQIIYIVLCESRRTQRFRVIITIMFYWIINIISSIKNCMCETHVLFSRIPQANRSIYHGLRTRVPFDTRTIHEILREILKVR